MMQHILRRRRRDISPGGGAEPTPITILGDKLEFWFNNDNSDNITQSEGRMISQVDETGNYTRSKPSGIDAPFLNSSLPFADHGRILFAGSEGLDLSSVITGQQGELFVVFRRHNSSTVGLTNNQFFFAVQDKDVNNNFVFITDLANSNTHNNSLGINCNFNGTLQIGYLNSKKCISDKKTIGNWRSNGTNYGMGFDRDLSMSSTFSSGDNGNWFGDIVMPDLCTFGYRNINGLAYSSHYEYEVIYCNQVLTTDERSQILSYLNNKHDCYRDVVDHIGVVYFGSSNCAGQSIVLSNRLKVSIPQAFIRTGTDTFSTLLYNSNNEGNVANGYGSEISLMACLSEYFGKSIYISKHGRGGARFCIIDGSNPVTGSTDTFKVSAADEYTILQTEATELQDQLDSLGTSKVILFLIGGENDTFYAGDGNGFETNLNEVINALLAQNVNITHYVINNIQSALSGTGPSPTRQASAITTVKSALTNVKNSKTNSVLLDMANYTTGEGVHFQGTEHTYIGRDAFELIKEYL